MTKEDYKIFSIQTTSEIEKEIKEVALQEDRSKNYIVNLAIKEYLDSHRNQSIKSPARINL